MCVKNSSCILNFGSSATIDVESEAIAGNKPTQFQLYGLIQIEEHKGLECNSQGGMEWG